MAKTKKTTTAKKTTRTKSTTAKESTKPTKKSTARATSKKGTRAASKTQTQKGAAKKSTAGETEVTVDRRQSQRRAKSDPTATDQRKLERREKVTRRRQIDPTTCERDYSDEEVEFMSALDNYKRVSGRMFPTCSEILEVIRELGYVRVSADQAKSPEAGLASEQEPVAMADAVLVDQNDESLADEDVFAAEELLV